MGWFEKLKLFMTEVWTEIRPNDGKVTWPGKEEVLESTMVVFLCVVVFSLFLALLDAAFRKLIGILVGQ